MGEIYRSPWRTVREAIGVLLLSALIAPGLIQCTYYEDRYEVVVILEAPEEYWADATVSLVWVGEQSDGCGSETICYPIGDEEVLYAGEQVQFTDWFRDDEDIDLWAVVWHDGGQGLDGDETAMAWHLTAGHLLKGIPVMLPDSNSEEWITEKEGFCAPLGDRF